MFGMRRHELRFALVISATHLTQHFLLRLIPPLIPVLAVALEYPLWKLGLLVSVFSLGSGFGQAPWGVLSDKYDRRYILPTGVAVAGACYVLFAAAPIVGSVVPNLYVFGYAFQGSFLVMCFAMLISGVSTAVVHPTGYPMITANVSEENKGKVLGAFGSSSKLGDAAAPAIVGVLILVLVWEQVLALLGLVGFAYGIILYVILRSDEFETVPVERGTNDEGVENSETVWGGDNRTYMYPMVVMYLFFITKKFTSKGLQTFIPAFLVGVYTYTFEFGSVSLAAESVANFYFTALLFIAAVTQLILGGMIDRYDPRLVLLCCVAVATVSLVALALFDLTPLLLLLTLVVLGAGLWGLNPARDAIISDISPPEREGRTFGYLWTAVQLSGVAVPVLVGYLMETLGMRKGFLLLAAGTVLAGVSISLLFSDRIYITSPKPSTRSAD